MTLPVQPPFGAVYRGAVATCSPADAPADVLHGFGGLRNVEHQKPYCLDSSFLNGRRNTYLLVHAVAEPIRIQSRTKQTAAAVVNSNDDCATAGSIRHACDLIGQVPGRLLIVPVAQVESAARPTPPGLLLKVNLLSFDTIGQRTRRELCQRAVNESFQPLTSLYLIGSRTKRRHWDLLEDYYQISCLII